MKIIDLIGKRFGNLLVLQQDPVDNFYVGCNGRHKRNIKWICECSCGIKTSIYGEHLRSGKTTHCRDCGYVSSRCNGRMSSLPFAAAKDRAKKKNMKFTITKEYIIDLYNKQDRKCALSGLDIVFADTIKSHKNGGTTASLDRIDSTRGYEINNVQWLHKDINKMKMDLELHYFLKLCNLINK